MSENAKSNQPQRASAMKQLGQSYRSGKITLEDVGYPALRAGGVIIRV
jgi:hypothetical protein